VGKDGADQSGLDRPLPLREPLVLVELVIFPQRCWNVGAERKAKVESLLRGFHTFSVTRLDAAMLRPSHPSSAAANFLSGSYSEGAGEQHLPLGADDEDEHGLVGRLPGGMIDRGGDSRPARSQRHRLSGRRTAAAEMAAGGDGAAGTLCWPYSPDPR